MDVFEEEGFGVDDSKMNDLEADDFEVNDLPNTNKMELEKPMTEMSFETIEEAHDYYMDYEGKHTPPRTKKVDLVASNNQGGKVKAKQRKRNCSTIKYACKAHLNISYEDWSSRWKVTDFYDAHNHPLVSPSKRMKMRSNKKMPDSVKNLTEVFQKENLKICKIPSVIGGEHMGVDNRALYNHLRNVRHRNVDGGDAQSVLNYFKNKQAQNPQFFYAIQCDENGRAANFFWVDSQSRMAYQYFGDVVSFDTTYRTNKYDMPFAPFTGVNHHWQSIQFGCALLQDETVLTFIWLFQTWLEAIGERAPIDILTDQDLAMKAAIAKVFPNTCHRLCYWHIKKKFAEKFSHVYYKKSKFKKDVKKCLWYTYTKEEFEKRWISLMNEYGLESNEWLLQMYDIRELWVPAYNRGTFFAGMNTTGRSEGVNSFFNEFVTSTTNLKEFFYKYEQALKKIVQKENDEDFESEHIFRIVNENEFLLKDAARIYTRNFFNKFKDEMTCVFNYKVEEERKSDRLHSFIVTSKIYESEKFIVTLDLETNEGACECQYFEFVGILCRHILKVFVRIDIDKIPDHFILPRWKQKANKFIRAESVTLENGDGNEESETLRLGHMCQVSTKLACLVFPSYEGYKIYIKTMNDLSEKLERYIKICDHAPPAIKEKIPIDPSQVLLLDPNISQTKGKKKVTDERLRSGLEISKKKRKCKGCNKYVRHDWRTCPENPRSKSSKALEAEGECSSSDEE